jgi:hypothetical protein
LLEKVLFESLELIPEAHWRASIQVVAHQGHPCTQNAGACGKEVLPRTYASG